MNAVLSVLGVFGQVLAVWLLVLILIATFVVLVVLPTIAAGALLVAILDRRLTRPDPLDRAAVQRRIATIVITFVVASLASVRVLVALNDAIVEPLWAVALIVAGVVQIVTAVVTVRRGASWQSTRSLVGTLGLHFAIGLVLVFAGPLLGVLR